MQLQQDKFAARRNLNVKWSPFAAREIVKLALETGQVSLEDLEEDIEQKQELLDAAKKREKKSAVKKKKQEAQDNNDDGQIHS